MKQGRKQVEAPYRLWEQCSVTDEEIEACKGDYIGCEICRWGKRCAMLLSKKIEEVETETEFDDEKVKRIFNEVGLTVEKCKQPLTDEELDKQVKEIVSCFVEVQNGKNKG